MIANVAKEANGELPLVTFALFAYNQEQYIREAIEAALAQDYPNLEIIISDDRSQDSTWDVIRTAAASYSGPHRLIVRQSERNRGVLHHVMDVAKQAEGRLLVLAAGDDISKPTRTSSLVSVWQKTGAWGLCSRFDRIDGAGRTVEQSVASSVLDGKGFRKYFYEEDGDISIVHGCSSAYDARIFSYIRISEDDFILSEDGALSVLINMLGKKIIHLEDSLVGYREHASSLTNARTSTAMDWSRLVREEDKIAWFAMAQANRCRFFLRMNEELSGKKVRRLRMEPIQQDLKRQELRASWWEVSFFRRLANLPFLIGHGEGKWALARLGGKNQFLLLKLLRSRMTHAPLWSRGGQHG